MPLFIFFCKSGFAKAGGIGYKRPLVITILRALLITAGVLFLIASKLFASAGDIYGLSSVSSSTGGVSLPSRPDISTTYQNPAFLGSVENLRMTLGWMAISDSLAPIQGVIVQNDSIGKGLEIGDFLTDYPNLSGFNFGLMFPLRKPLPKIAFGMTGFVPVGSIANIETSEGVQAVYSNYAYRPRHFSWIVGGSIEVLKNLSLGLAGNIYWTSGANSQININGKNSTVALAMDIKPAVAPIIGLHYLLSRWGFDASYHAPVDYQFVFKNRSDLVLFGNTGEGGEVSAPIIQFLSESSMFYDPQMIGLGISRRFLNGFSVGTKWLWKNWKKYRSPINRVSFTNPGDLKSSVPKLEFRDVISPGFGVEVPVLSWFLRAGYRYEPERLIHQDENSNFLDTDVHLLSTGMGHTFGSFLGIWTQPVTLDAHLQYHRLILKTIYKQNPEAIGYKKEGYSIGGSLLNYGLNLSMTF